MSDHARLAPSAADRWMKCSGSIALIDAVTVYVDNEVNTPAQQAGIDAHNWGEKVLLDEAVPADVPEEHRDVVVGYVEMVEHYKSKLGPGTKMHVEVKLRNPKGTPHVWGTSDVVLISKDEKEMAIIDLKNGRIGVEAEENMQLTTYATLAAGHYGISPKKTHLVIYQPRAMDNLPAVRETTINKKQLKAFTQEINAAAELALSPAGERLFNPSEKACRWCDARGHCSAQANQSVIEDFWEETKPPTAILSNEQLAEMLAAVPLVDEYINALRKAAYERAMADESLPGFKLVHSRTVRKWDDAKAVEKILRENKIDKALYLDTKLKSFTKLEKLPETAELVADHIIKPVGALQLALESDPREEAGPGDDFADDLK